MLSANRMGRCKIYAIKKDIIEQNDKFYAGYIARNEREIAAYKRDADLKIPSDFKYDNDGSISLTYGQNTDSNVVFDDFSLQGMSELANQQLLDATTPESSGLPQNTAYSAGFKIYYKSNTIYKLNSLSSI